MAQDFDMQIPPIEPTPPPPEKKNNTTLIIVIVLIVLVILCCCLLMGVLIYLLYQHGDEWFNISSTLLSLLTV